MRRWLGGTWNDALRRARLQAVPDGDALVSRLGAPITREEAVAALRQFVDEHNHIPTLSQYCLWAKRPDVRRRPGKRPLSRMPFERLFAGWSPALKAAGLIQGDSPARPLGHGGIVVPSGYGFSTKDMRAALQEVATMVGHPPRTTEYIRMRAELLDRQDPTGKPLRALPSYNVINRNYATWDDALADAGLERLGGRGTGYPDAKKPNEFSDEDILTAVASAQRELGTPLSVMSYSVWRIRRLEAAEAEGRLVKVPHSATAGGRFGGWAKVCAAAQASGGSSD